MHVRCAAHGRRCRYHSQGHATQRSNPRPAQEKARRITRCSDGAEHRASENLPNGEADPSAPRPRIDLPCGDGCLLPERAPRHQPEGDAGDDAAEHLSHGIETIAQRGASSCSTAMPAGEVFGDVVTGCGTYPAALPVVLTSTGRVVAPLCTAFIVLVSL